MFQTGNTLRISGRCDSNVSCRRAPRSRPNNDGSRVRQLAPLEHPAASRPRGPDSPALRGARDPSRAWRPSARTTRWSSSSWLRARARPVARRRTSSSRRRARPVCSPSASSWTWKGSDRLEHDPALGGHLALLRVFAHGTLPEYRAALASGAALPRSPPRRSSSSRSSPSPPWLSAPRRSATTISWPRSRCPRFVSSKTSSSTSASAPVSPAANSTSAARVSRCTRPSAAISDRGNSPSSSPRSTRGGKTPSARYGRRGEGSMGERRAGEGVSA